MIDTDTNVQTKAVCRVPLVGCLKKASEYKSLPLDWQPINDEQENFLRHMRLVEELSNLTPEEYDAIASDNEAEINQWLEDNGFSIKCPPIVSGGFGMASFVKLFVEWQNEGKIQDLMSLGNTEHKAVFFNDINGYDAKLNDDTVWNVTKLQTKDSKTHVWCAMGDNLTNYTEEELLTVANEIQNNRNVYPGGQFYEGVVVPMINLDMTISQDWILGIKNQEWSVSGCVQQFILKLNEKGATAKSAVAMVAARGMLKIPPRLTFNKPFILWFSREGCTYPLFLAVCGYDCWKEPADLN